MPIPRLLCGLHLSFLALQLFKDTAIYNNDERNAKTISPSKFQKSEEPNSYELRYKY